MKEHKEAYEDIVDSLLPIASLLLEDEKTEVRQEAVNCVVTIAECIEEDDLGQYILTIILVSWEYRLVDIMIHLLVFNEMIC